MSLLPLIPQTVDFTNINYFGCILITSHNRLNWYIKQYFSE